MRALGSRYLVLPFAALLLLLSGGATAVQDCHITSATQTHAHDGHPHTHEGPASAPLNSNASSGSSLNFEVCFAVGFLVLLILRFINLKFNSFKILKSEFPKLKILAIKLHRPWFLHPTHLQLGIIRI